MYSSLFLIAGLALTGIGTYKTIKGVVNVWQRFKR
jgi:hypothetical protein